MTWTTHDRDTDHHGTEKDTVVVIDGATTSYGDGDGLHTVLSDMDDRIVAAAASGGSVDLITGDSSTFDAGLGDWTNSGGTLTRDTTAGYRLGDLSASLKWAATAQNQYIELPIAGTFKAGKRYQLLLVLRHEDADTASGISWRFRFGDGASDYTNTEGSSIVSFLAGQWFAFLLEWGPTADRSGATFRFTRPGVETGTENWHIGMVKAIEVPADNATGLGLWHVPGDVAGKVTIAGNAGMFGIVGSTGAGLWVTYFGARIYGDADGEHAFYANEAEAGGWAMHTPGDLAGAGLDFEVGDDFVGFYMSEKDATTVQFYGDYDDYDFEFVDGAARGWKFVSDAGAMAWPARGMLPQYASAPHSGTETEGESYYDTTTHKSYTWDGSTWQAHW